MILNQERYSGKLSLLLLVTAIAGAFFFCFFKIDKSVWLDEANSVLTALNPFEGIIASLIRENNAPGYYILLHYWMKVFGFEPFAVRLLSAIFYLLTPLIIYKIAIRLFNDRNTALFSAVFFIISPIAVSQSQNVRMYAMLVFLAAASTYFFLLNFHYRERKKIGIYIWILLNAVGLFVHYWYLFVIIAQGVCFLIFYVRNQTILYRFIFYNFVSSIPFMLLWLPAMIEQLGNGSNSWMPAPPISAIPDTLSKFLGGSYLGYSVLLVSVLLPAIQFKNKTLRFSNKNELKTLYFSKEQNILYILCATSIIVPWLVSLVQPIFTERYTIIALPAFALAIGRLHGKAHLPNFSLLFATLLIMLVSIGLFKHRNRPIERSDALSVEQFLKISEPEDVIIFTSLSRPATEYYLLLNNANDNYEKYSFPAELEFHPSWRNIDDFLNRSDEIEKEAKDLVTLLSQDSYKGKKIWVLYGRDNSVDKPLKELLDEKFKLIESHELGLEVLFYTEILEFESRSD